MSANTLYMSLAAGILLMLTSCFGVFGTQRGHKGLLFCYLIFLTGVLALQCASAYEARQYWVRSIVCKRGRLTPRVVGDERANHPRLGRHLELNGQ